MWEKWKQAVYNSQAIGAQVTEFSKAPICLPRELLTAELKAYRFGLQALKLMNN